MASARTLHSACSLPIAELLCSAQLGPSIKYKVQSMKYGPSCSALLCLEPEAVATDREHRAKRLASLAARRRGYVDDPRNTDNAWIETTANHYHCSDALARLLPLNAGDDALKAMWLTIDVDRRSAASVFSMCFSPALVGYPCLHLSTPRHHLCTILTNCKRALREQESDSSDSPSILCLHLCLRRCLLLCLLLCLCLCLHLD